jgi:hypothetical protein
VRHRFHDRVVITAGLTQSLFATSALSTQVTAATQLGSKRVKRAELDRYAARSQLAYALLRDRRGRLLATTTSTTLERRSASVPSYVRAALGGRAELSNLLPGPQPGRPVVEWAIPFRSRAGPRVLVSAIREEVLGGFLGRFLGQLPSAGSASQSAVIDASGRVIGTAIRGLRAGSSYPDAAAVRAMARRMTGAYDAGGHKRQFVSAAIAGTPWRVILTASESSLYQEINGSRRTVPWVLLVAFALVGLGGLLALRRAGSARAEIYRRNLRRQHALEINDNVIQNLVIMRYSLDHGNRGAADRKLAETLNEARRLVNEILGEEAPEPGDLRRSAHTPNPPQ